MQPNFEKVIKILVCFIIPVCRQSIIMLPLPLASSFLAGGIIYLLWLFHSEIGDKDNVSPKKPEKKVYLSPNMLHNEILTPSILAKAPERLQVDQILKENDPCENFMSLVCNTGKSMHHQYISKEISKQVQSSLKGVLNVTSDNNDLQKERDWINTCSKPLDLHANQEFVKKLTKKFFIGLPILFNMNNTFNKSMQGFVEDYARETKDIIFFNIVNENNLILLLPNDMEDSKKSLTLSCDDSKFKEIFKILRQNGTFYPRSHDCPSRINEMKDFYLNLTKIQVKPSSEEQVFKIIDLQNKYANKCVYSDDSKIEWAKLVEIVFDDVLLDVENMKIKVKTDYLDSLCKLLKSTTKSTFVDYIYWTFLFNDNIYKNLISDNSGNEERWGKCKEEFPFNLGMVKKLVGDNRDKIKQMKKLIGESSNSTLGSTVFCSDFLNEATDSSYTDILNELHITDNYMSNFKDLKKVLRRQQAKDLQNSFNSKCGPSYHIKDEHVSAIIMMLSSTLFSGDFASAKNFGNKAYVNVQIISNQIMLKDLEGIGLDCLQAESETEPIENSKSNHITLGLLLTLADFRKSQRKTSIKDDALFFISFANNFCETSSGVDEALLRIKEFRKAICPKKKETNKTCYLK